LERLKRLSDTLADSPLDSYRRTLREVSGFDAPFSSANPSAFDSFLDDRGERRRGRTIGDNRSIPTMKPITRGRIARIEPDFDVDDVESRKGQNTLNGKPSAAFNDVDDGATLDLPSGVNFVLVSNTLAAGFFAYLGSVEAALIVLGGNVAAIVAIALATAAVQRGSPA
jgi:hypothetical protein